MCLSEGVWGKHPPSWADTPLQADITPWVDTPQADTPLGRHPTIWADTPSRYPIGRHSQADIPCSSACCDTHTLPKWVVIMPILASGALLRENKLLPPASIRPGPLINLWIQRFMGSIHTGVTSCYWIFLFPHSKASDSNIGIIANFGCFEKPRCFSEHPAFLNVLLLN